MEQEDFNEWLDDHRTHFFFNYLLDSNKKQAELIAEAVMEGNVFDLNEQLRIATECFTLKRVTEITFEEIRDFYQEEKVDARSIGEQGDY